MITGSGRPDLLPGIVIMGAGVGLVLVGVQNAANGGVPADKAGHAASLITASFQLGGALGLAVFTSLIALRSPNVRVVDEDTAVPAHRKSTHSRAAL
jgi:tellurite resistance protein TehA-like permease